MYGKCYHLSSTAEAYKLATKGKFNGSSIVFFNETHFQYLKTFQLGRSH